MGDVYKNFKKYYPLLWVVLYLTPFFAFDYLAQQDTPNHMAITKILNDLDNGAEANENYDKNLKFAPYALYYFVTKNLIHVLTPAWAHKLVYLFIFLASGFFIFKTLALTGNYDHVKVFLLLPLAYSTNFVMGFAPFQLSVPFGLGAAYLLLRELQTSAGFKNFALIALALLLACLAHPLGLAYVGFALGALLLGSFASYKKWLALAAASVPALTLQLATMTKQEFEPVYATLYEKTVNLMLYPFAAIDGSHYLLNLIIPGVIVTVCAVFVFLNRRSYLWHQRENRQYFTLAVTAVLLVGLYFALPYKPNHDSVYIDFRLASLIWVFMILALPTMKSRLFSLVVQGVLVFHIHSVYKMHRSYNDNVEKVVQIAERMEKGKTFIPFNYEFVADDYLLYVVKFNNRESRRLFPATSFVHHLTYINILNGGASPFLTFSPTLKWIPIVNKTPTFDRLIITDIFRPTSRMLGFALRGQLDVDYFVVYGGSNVALSTASRLSKLYPLDFKSEENDYFVFRTRRF